MAKVYNRARMTTATTGTGTITLGSAVTGYQTFVAAGAVNNDVLYYTIEDGTAWEVGKGTYTTVGTTLSRTLIQSSTGSLLTLSGTAEVFITAPAQLLQMPDPGILAVTSAAGTTTLTADSPRTVYVTGTAAQTFVLPDVTTLSLGWTIEIVNSQTTGAFTVQSSGLNAFGTTIGAGGLCQFTCIATTGTGIASWQQKFVGATSRTGGGAALVYSVNPLLWQILRNASNSFTAGTNAQGQGAITEDFVTITTAAANPSGVTLPSTGFAANQTRHITILNRGANPVNVYPATGHTINTLAANAAISLPVGGMMRFWNSSTTQWWTGAYQPIATPGAVLSTSATLGIGYGTGSGGTASQATSRTTGVTLNTVNGAITLFSTTTTAGTRSSFTVTNSAVAATDNVLVSLVSAATADAYDVTVTAIAAGSFRIQVTNIAAVAVAEAPVVKFTVIKGTSA